MALETSLHPAFLLLAAIGIVCGLFALHDRAPILIPLLFAASLAGILFRWLQILRERRRRRDSTAVVDFAALRRRELGPAAERIKQSLRGHDEVVDALLARLQRNLAVAAPTRTLGAFLFAGPSGTGKTFLAELLAQTFYPDREPVLLRMGQYKSAQDVATLLGPPPGQPGYEVGGALTRPVIAQPYRVVILDEFDKCHPEVQRCVYDILERGHYSEKSSGRTAHFGACVFVATCNAGVEGLRALYAQEGEPFARAARAREVLAREGFDKALLARFDDIFLLDRLQALEVAEIACLQLARQWRQYGIEVSYAAPEVLAEALRRNREFQDDGVRQLSRLIQELATPSIEAACRSGASRVRLGLDHGSGRVLVATDG